MIAFFLGVHAISFLRPLVDWVRKTGGGNTVVLNDGVHPFKTNTV